jgi:two-component system, cell cycle sensor histidine kinase and response regulator CckA
MPDRLAVGSTLEERRARVIVDRLPLVTYMVRLEAPSGAVFVSPQMESLFGFGKEAFAESPDFWERRMAPEDLPRFLTAFTELRESHGQMSVEYRITASDGREVWVRDIGVVERDDDGEFYVHGHLTDVTREKELERELAAERAQAEAFFRDSPTGMGITDSDGRYLRVNEALAGMNGATVESHLGRTLAELAPALAQEVAPLLERVHGTGESLFQREIRIERGGEQGSYLLSYFPIELEGDVRYGRIVVDITKQRQVEEQYRRLIEQLPLVTYVHTLEPAVKSTYVSPQIEELYGYPAAQWLEEPELWARTVHPDDLELVKSSELTAREHCEAFELEYRIVRADGTVRWVLDSMNTARDADGTPLFEQGFLVDVTERKESENLFRAVFDGAFEAMVISNDEGRYVDVNPAACEVFGRTHDELVGMRVGAVSGTPEHAGTTWRSLLDEGAVKGPYDVVRPDGTVRETELSARANVLPGRHISVLRDVTERKQLERDLWRAQRLESVGRLAGGVAHDFNNLLTAIRGYAQLLLERVAAGSIEHHHAEEIDRAANRAAGLTAQLLAFGRRQLLQARPTELNRLVEKLEDMLGSLVGDGVELRFELDPAVRPVRVDPAQIEQVLVSLVMNAADVTPAGGQVIVRTANADAQPSDDLVAGRYGMLSVEDSGPGVDESALEHLFEPFFTTKDVGHGVGLGLATAYGIAKQSGGTISVATAPGAGSTFAVFLPESFTGTGETIVVIESDPAVRDVLFEVLSDAGYRVVTAPTPADAEHLAERLEDPIDLVLTELDEKQAAALAESLRAERALSLRKPYSPEHLRESVRSELDVPAKG